MTDAELDELVANCPKLYHMAERGSWPSIRQFGLLSTSALLDLYHIEEPDRERIERRHRPASVPIRSDGLPGAVVRDQIPMSDDGLRKALPERLKPSDWYSLLNSKVFFWLSRERLLKLTGAKTYRDAEHDVLEIDTQSLLDAYRERIWLCPINSGCTKPFPHPRDERAFLRVTDYPYAYWRERRRATERAVELAVDYAVSDIANHVTRVVVMRGSDELAVLHPTSL
ncbi:hypothetical protein GCM10022268_00150 [Sphingomonas cynarae]|uniref:Uncharacterized protein n=1 Tax=Sphingomonas cynarae TaxID=930197 RepID=A0ABP7CRN7_9SPHN